MLHVNLTTTPDSNVMQPTEKSGVVTFSGSSAATCLSGHTQAENAVTVVAGPKKAVNQVR